MIKPVCLSVHRNANVSTGVCSDVKECVWVWYLLSIQYGNATPNKQTHTHRVKELAHLLRWNKTVPSAENRTTEGKKPTVLIGIPSSWSSWIQTLSHSGLTRGDRKKTTDRESGNDREHIFDCSQKADPTSPPPLICIPQLPMWLHFVCFLWGQTEFLLE